MKKRNAQGKFISTKEDDNKTEVFSIRIPEGWTMIRYLITLIIFAPWIYIMMYRLNIKEKVLNLLIWLFDNAFHAEENGKRSGWQ